MAVDLYVYKSVLSSCKLSYRMCKVSTQVTAILFVLKMIQHQILSLQLTALYLYSLRLPPPTIDKSKCDSKYTPSSCLKRIKAIYWIHDYDNLDCKITTNRTVWLPITFEAKLHSKLTLSKFKQGPIDKWAQNKSSSATLLSLQQMQNWECRFTHWTNCKLKWLLRKNR